MEPEGVRRRLAAILAADVAGYTRLMETDEEATLAAWWAARREVIDPAIGEHRGRIVKHTGDGFLAEFATALDAVRCAIAMQSALATLNADRPADRRLNFRMGVNLGDIVVDDEDIYGDGVNIAARIESLADAGGVSVSGSIHEQVHKKLDAIFKDMGEQQVKHISEPIRIYKIALGTPVAAVPSGRGRYVMPTVAAALTMLVAAAVLLWLEPWTPALETASIERMAFPLPDKPSIAVLPLDNMSGDPGQEYFSDGITENIITALSKVPRLFVIARNSTFVYKGKPVKVQSVAEELGVRFVLEGSVQRSDNRVRVTIQLIDALTGNHLWAERYDRDLTDLFAVQDEIARKIAEALEIKLTEGEQARAWRRQTNNWKAGDLLSQAAERFERFSKEGNFLAREKVGQAIEIDPRFALAYAILGWTHWLDAQQGWSGNPTVSFARALEAAQKALALDPSLPDAHALMGTIHLRSGDFEQAVRYGERAVALNPNHATNMALLGMILSNAGRPQEAIQRFKTAMRLSPYYPDWFLSELGWAYEMAEQHEDAITAFGKYLERQPDGPMVSQAHIGLALVYHALGRDDVARTEVAAAVENDPTISVTRMRIDALTMDRDGVDKMLDTLRTLGLPE
ncbi:MAG: adenylate/guanylate cyclase domain-containing protein [Rhodospirillales bacterium]|nr:adenylate/guanylate cyclase domain-containing protein [Rhodospirillales bacterium]